MLPGQSALSMQQPAIGVITQFPLEQTASSQAVVGQSTAGLVQATVSHTFAVQTPSGHGVFSSQHPTVESYTHCQTPVPGSSQEAVAESWQTETGSVVQSTPLFAGAAH